MTLLIKTTFLPRVTCSLALVLAACSGEDPADPTMTGDTAGFAGVPVAGESGTAGSLPQAGALSGAGAPTVAGMTGLAGTGNAGAAGSDSNVAGAPTAGNLGAQAGMATAEAGVATSGAGMAGGDNNGGMPTAAGSDNSAGTPTEAGAGMGDDNAGAAGDDGAAGEDGAAGQTDAAGAGPGDDMMTGGAGNEETAGMAAMAGMAGTDHEGVWKVMPLGDSLTASTCYPQVLSQQFIDGGHTNFEFVGTQTTSQSCGGAPAVKAEGHGGYGVTYLPQDSSRGACTKSSGCGSYSELQTWAAQAVDIVLIHYGTNDVWDGQSPTNILAAYASVMAEFRKNNPDVIFVVSKIIKLNPSGCGSCLSNVEALANALTDDWATANSTATSPVHIIDNFNSGFDPNNNGDTTDGVHPTLAGATKMATATYEGVTALGYF